MEIQNQLEILSPVRKVPTTKVFPDGRRADGESTIICEHGMELYVQGNFHGKYYCSPSYLVEFVLGKLLCEQMIEKTSDVSSVFISPDGKRCEVSLTRLVEKKEIPVFDAMIRKQCQNMGATDIFPMITAFAQDGKIHRETKGTHSALLFYRKELVFRCEDIGRHNALDKAGLAYTCLTDNQQVGTVFTC